MRTLKHPIRAGEKTCAEVPGVFCTHLRTRMDGHNPVCSLYGTPLFEGEGEVEGWLVRCAQCLEEDVA